MGETRPNSCCGNGMLRKLLSPLSLETSCCVADSQFCRWCFKLTLSNPAPFESFLPHSKSLIGGSLWPRLDIDLHSSCQREGRGMSCPLLASGVECPLHGPALILSNILCIQNLKFKKQPQLILFSVFLLVF